MGNETFYGDGLTLSICACSPKKDTSESFILLFFPQEKLVQLFILKPSPDSKMIKLLTCDNLSPPLRHSR